MENKKIYLVTRGDYSDYGVSAVFTTEDLAQIFIDSFKPNGYDEFRIEEYDLNPQEEALREGFKAYFVRMSKEGKALDVSHEENNCGFDRPYAFDIKDNLYCHTFAKDKRHAIKIVNEKRGQLIALDRWGRQLNK